MQTDCCCAPAAHPRPPHSAPVAGGGEPARARRVLGAEVSPSARRSLLVDFITVYGLGGKAIVFTETKREADEVAAALASTHPCEARARPPPLPFSPAGGSGRPSIGCPATILHGGEASAHKAIWRL